MGNNNIQVISGRQPLTGQTVLIDNDFYNRVSSGLVPGHQRFGFAGHNPASELGVEETIWFRGGKRTLLATAKDLYISSTDAGDNSSITIICLDSLWRLTTRIARLDGQNQVLIGGGALIRVWVSATIGGGDANGTIYVAEKDTEISGGVPALAKTQSVMAPGRRLSWNGFITCPLGYVIKFTRIRITPIKEKVSNIYFASREPSDGGWLYATPFESGQNYDFQPSSAVTEKTDIEFTVISEDNLAKSTVVCDTMLIDEKYL